MMPSISNVKQYRIDLIPDSKVLFSGVFETIRIFYQKVKFILIRLASLESKHILKVLFLEYLKQCKS